MANLPQGGMYVYGCYPPEKKWPDDFKPPDIQPMYGCFPPRPDRDELLKEIGRLEKEIEILKKK